jgi:hypothetical protein
MRRNFQLSVRGGTIHLLLLAHLEALQALVSELGAIDYPLFLRLGSTQLVRLQPVSARALLAEVDRFAELLVDSPVPGVSFRDAQGEELGTKFSGPAVDNLAANDTVAMGATHGGIRLVVGSFPPPAGFRSRSGLPPMHYECFFRQIDYGDGAWYGLRMPTMGGADAPVQLPAIPLPPVTRWDTAHVAGQPAVASISFVQRQATEVYRDLLHSFRSACDESLRLKVPFEFRLV